MSFMTLLLTPPTPKYNSDRRETVLTLTAELVEVLSQATLQSSPNVVNDTVGLDNSSI